MLIQGSLKNVGFGIAKIFWYVEDFETLYYEQNPLVVYNVQLITWSSLAPT